MNERRSPFFWTRRRFLTGAAVGTGALALSCDGPLSQIAAATDRIGAGETALTADGAGYWYDAAVVSGFADFSPTAIQLDERRILICGNVYPTLFDASVGIRGKLSILSPDFISQQDRTDGAFVGNAVRLLNGNILLISFSLINQPIGSHGARCWIYDPISNVTRRTGDAPFGYNIGGNGAGALLLADGRVLWAGGYPETLDAPGSTDFSTGDTSMLYDPVSGTWDYTRDLTRAGNVQTKMVAKATNHDYLQLANGKVLMVCGAGDVESLETFNEKDSLVSVQLWDPATGKWAAPESVQLPVVEGEGPGRCRSQTRLSKLADGRILVAGGWSHLEFASEFFVRKSAFTFSETTMTWTRVGDLPFQSWNHRVARQTPGGGAYVMGGLGPEQNPDTYLNTACSLFDPISNGFTPVAPLQELFPGVPQVVPWFSNTLTMPNGSVLWYGSVYDIGYDAFPSPRLQIYVPGNAPVSSGLRNSNVTAANKGLRIARANAAILKARQHGVYHP